MSRKLKDLMIQEYTDRFSDLGRCGCVVFGYQGLDANATAEVRRLFGKHGSEMFVIRNRLMALSLEEIGIPELKNCFRGPSAIVKGDDPVQAAKAVEAARKEYAALTVYGGYAEGKLLAQEDVERLADIPDREVLLSRTLGLISSPAQRFVNGLNNAMVRFVSVVNQLKEKKEGEDSAE